MVTSCRPVLVFVVFWLVTSFVFVVCGRWGVGVDVVIWLSRLGVSELCWRSFNESGVGSYFVDLECGRFPKNFLMSVCPSCCCCLNRSWQLMKAGTVVVNQFVRNLVDCCSISVIVNGYK